jgi:hypothetical protein
VQHCATDSVACGLDRSRIAARRDGKVDDAKRKVKQTPGRSQLAFMLRACAWRPNVQARALGSAVVFKGAIPVCRWDIPAWGHR